MNFWDIYVLFGGQKQKKFVMESDDKGRINPSLRISKEKIIDIYERLEKFMHENKNTWSIFDASTTAI